jgi:hypothetical protein
LFALGCVYLCSHLPYTFDGWVSILEFYFLGFSSCYGGQGWEKNGQNSKSKVTSQKGLTVVQCRLTQGQELDEEPQPIECPTGALGCASSFCVVLWEKETRLKPASF